MAASVTLTLTGVGRAPGAFRASALSASCALLVNSGSVMLMPHAASGFTCWNVSCLGNKGVGLGKGMIGVPRTGGEQSGIITLSGAGHIALGAVSVERITGTGTTATTVATGGGTQT